MIETVELIENNGTQTLRLPDEFRFSENKVAIRREGDAVILEPVRPTEWPEGFFDAIHISDPAFLRPEQGETPPAPELD